MKASLNVFFEEDWFSNSPVPELLEDESVYSWCARFHRINGCYESRVTSRVLFGHPTAGLRHDIPGHMGEFQCRTQNALGNSRELLLKRTLFCFHSPFLPIELEDELLNLLIAGDNTIVRKQLGLERAGLPNVNQLKFCPECVAEQIQENGVAWWLISQQLPTAFLCRTHGEWLCSVMAKQYRGVFRNFQTPLESLQGHTPKHHELTSADRESLVSLAHWANQVQNSAGSRFSDATLRHCYLLKAKAQGWLAFDGSLRMQKVRDVFIDKYGGVLQLFGSEFFGDLHGVNAGFLAYMFRKLPSRRHPLKHLLLMNLLFESVEELLEINQKIQRILTIGGEEAVNKMMRDGQSKLLKLVTADGLPVSQAAAEVGTSNSSAVKYLNNIGMKERSLRPHIVGTAKEQKLRKLLMEGVDRSEVATTLGVRPAFIKDYLANRPDLKKIWMDAHRILQVQLHREQLSTMLKKHSDLPIKSIRRLPNNGFQWLYTNDLEWLLEILPAIWKR